MTKVQSAASWLRGVFGTDRDLAIPAARMLAEGQARGYDRKTMARARQEAGIISVFMGGFGPNGSWMWRWNPRLAETRGRRRHVQAREPQLLTRQRQPEPEPEIVDSPMVSLGPDKRAIVGGMAKCPNCGRMQIAKPLGENVCIGIGCRGVIPVR
jgi:hypothetical protein